MHDNLASGRMDHPSDMTPRAQITAVPWQVMRLEPIVAHVVGGGTSGVILRGDQQPQHGGVRVSQETRETAGDPLVETSLTAVS